MAPRQDTLPLGLRAATPLPARGRGRVRGIDRRLMRVLLGRLGDPPIRVALWDGRSVGDAAPESAPRMRIRDRRTLFRLLVGGEVAFGDAYSEGGIEVEGDLVDFLERVYVTAAPAPRRAASARNSRPRARTNARHHYDLGNDFYALWLDRRMVYTCAYFPSPEATLEAAQLAKLDHVCRKLRLAPGERVLEVGCGWGALALHMAERYGVTVRALNVSSEQVRWARGQARRLGLADRVEFVEDDYRNAAGTYDAFVSVGMLEHVGRASYPELGRLIDRSLLPSGRGLIHTIGRARPGRLSRWIERRIFPGAYPPTLREIAGILEPHDLAVLDVENLRPHYARTLEHWLQRFERSSVEIRQRYGESFRRAWRLYLAGSIAAFRTGALELFQVVFTRGRGGPIPWTRADLYS